jgi:hypothetical protein
MINGFGNSEKDSGTRIKFTPTSENSWNIPTNKYSPKLKKRPKFVPPYFGRPKLSRRGSQLPKKN